MQRITITLDDKLAEAFEAFRMQHGYGNRSEAFRDLVRERLGSEQLAQPIGAECLATLTYVYNHHELAVFTFRSNNERHHGTTWSF